MKRVKSKPKKQWELPFLLNKAVKDVVWGAINNLEKPIMGWVGITPSTKQFSDFVNKAQESIFTNGIMNVPNWEYDEIVEYAHQRPDYKVTKVALYTSDFVVANEDYGKVYLVPYSDGVMLYGINIKPELRGKGIGTDVINKMYDLSEELNIPIYLIPYPDDNFPTTDEKKLVDRLKSYYERIGFGPVNDNSIVWSNFE